MTATRSPGRPRSRGPRGGAADTRGDILEAAAAAFADKGYSAASMREIARAADVDPALVRHYFSSKADLFVAAMRPLAADDARIEALASVPRERLGEQTVRLFLSLWDDPVIGLRLRAMLGSVISIEEIGPAMADVLLRDLLLRIVREDDALMRASACGTQLIGLALGRYVIGLEALAEASDDELAALYGPTLQRYIDGDLTRSG